jgi:hypothetical protein
MRGPSCSAARFWPKPDRRDGPDRSSEADHAAAFRKPVGDQLSGGRRRSQPELAAAFGRHRYFCDSDEAVSGAALKDIADLESAGFRISVDVKAFGLFEATVSEHGSSTGIQWMSETR